MLVHWLVTNGLLLLLWAFLALSLLHQFSYELWRWPMSDDDDVYTAEHDASVTYIDDDDEDDPSLPLYHTMPYVCGKVLLASVLDSLVSAVSTDLYMYSPSWLFITDIVVVAGDWIRLGLAKVVVEFQWNFVDIIFLTESDWPFAPCLRPEIVEFHRTGAKFSVTISTVGNVIEERSNWASLEKCIRGQTIYSPRNMIQGSN